MGLFSGGNSSSNTTLNKDASDQSTNVGATKIGVGGKDNSKVNSNNNDYNLSGNAKLNIENTNPKNFAKTVDFLDKSLTNLLSANKLNNSKISEQQENYSKLLAGQSKLNVETIKQVSNAARKKGNISTNEKQILIIAILAIAGASYFAFTK